jgi:hypothetical protein
MGLLREIARFPNRGRGNFSKLPRERRERENVFSFLQYPLSSAYLRCAMRHHSSLEGRGIRERGGKQNMPKVIRLDPGGGSVVEQSELSIEQAQSLARSLKAIGEPAGCCWCVGLWDHEDEEEVAVQTPSYTRYHLNTQVPG